MTQPDPADPTLHALHALVGQALPPLLSAQGMLLSVKSAGSGRYLHAGPELSALLALDGEALQGRTDTEALEPVLAAALRAAEQTALAQGAPLQSRHEFESRGARHDYTVWRVSSGDCIVALWQDHAPERQREAQLRQAVEQIEQQQQAHDRLRREIADQALRDPATGLHRRAHFEDQLRREGDLSMREHREFSVVFIELDAFGPTVLALGGAGEKAVLEAMGRLLRSGTRAMDAACRFNDRRFAVLLSGVGLATAHARMEGLRRKCATQIVVHEGQELGFTVAMGVASYPHTAASQEALVQACEAALAEAQRRGGNHVTLAAIRFDAA